MKKTLILSLSILLSLEGLSQSIDCRKYFEKNSDGTIYDSFEDPPTPRQGYEEFYRKIDQAIRTVDITGKVFVRFIVDTVGGVHCAEVVKTENELLNAQAIALIEETAFIPAEQQGKKVVSTLILPITLGKPQKKKVRRGQHNPR